jgi:FkbM family methyltransferase
MLYGQAAEVHLLSRILPTLANRSVIDVGAERGGFTSAMLDAGATQVHAIEPEPRNAEALREHFGWDPRVIVHELAASDKEGNVDLHLSSSPAGEPLSFAHTLLDRKRAPDVAWPQSVRVEARRIGSLVAAGLLPSRVGILKVDTEGHDLAVVGAVGELDCDVIMTEYWLDLPRSLGPCPWTVDEMHTKVGSSSFPHFAQFVHQRGYTLLQWDNGAIPPGQFGNLVFLHKRIVGTVWPYILESAADLAREAGALADQRFEEAEAINSERRVQTRAAEKRGRALELVEAERAELERLASERLTRIEEVSRERDAQMSLAAERARAVEVVEAELEQFERLANAQLTTIEALRLAVPSQRPVPYPVRRARYELSRIRALGRPRLGRLRHYTPIPLKVPAAYLRDLPPEPALVISIVTPSFQHGQFLERTMRSVLDQHYPAIEYFVQDGSSNDGTPGLLARYENELSGWASEPDKGQADAINRGFARTTGEIMAWLNSDDLLLPGSLAYVAGFFSRHPDVDVVYGHRILIDESDGQIGVWLIPRHDDAALRLADFVPQETLFWRRRIWDGIGAELDLNFTYALDWDLLLRFQEAGAKMVRLPRFIGAFRIHDDQKTLAARSRGLAEMAILRERANGRPVPLHEVHRQLRPYMRRHTVLHLRQRLLDRMPLHRVIVTTAPPTGTAAPVAEPSPRPAANG